MHCNIFFSQFSIDSENPLNRFRQEVAAPRWMPLSPRLQQLEAPHPRPRSRVGGWCAAETLSELQKAGSRFLTHHSFGDCKLPAQPVSPWKLHCAPAGSTVLRGERGDSVSTCYPLASSRKAEGPQLCQCLCQTKMHHAVPETMALSQLNYGCTTLYLNTSYAFVYISIWTRTSYRKDL